VLKPSIADAASWPRTRARPRHKSVTRRLRRSNDKPSTIATVRHVWRAGMSETLTHSPLAFVIAPEFFEPFNPMRNAGPPSGLRFSGGRLEFWLASSHTTRLRRKGTKVTSPPETLAVAVMFVTPKLEALCVASRASISAAQVGALRGLSDVRPVVLACSAKRAAGLLVSLASHPQRHVPAKQVSGRLQATAPISMLI
jgi:hypothetical protein